MTEAELHDYLEDLFQACVSHTEGMAAFTWHGGSDGDLPDPDAILLTVYEGVTELVGGMNDGSEVYSGYTLCVNSIVQLLSEDDFKPHLFFCCDVGITKSNPELTVSGKWRGREVHVTFKTRPVEDAPTLIRQHPNGVMEAVDEDDFDDDDFEDDEDET